jgi:hypothetical protein
MTVVSELPPAASGVAITRSVVRSRIEPTCACTSALILQNGRAGCAACGAPLVVEVAGAGPETYRTTGPLPPGWSRRRFREAAPTIPGAERSGGKRGRSVSWTVSRVDFERWLSTRTAEQAAPAADAPDADAWIANAGYRPTAARLRVVGGANR